MPRLSDIASNSVHAEIKLYGETLNIDFYPLRITTKMMSQLTSWSNMSEADIIQRFNDIAQTLSEIIKNWDLQEDDLTPIALTYERLLRLSPVIAMVVIQGIVSNLRPETVAP